MIKNKINLLLFISVLTSGCSSTWYHPTLTENDFYRDREICNRYAGSANPDTRQPYDPYLDPGQQAQVASFNAGSQLGRSLGLQSSFKNCMYAKGYRDTK